MNVGDTTFRLILLATLGCALLSCRTVPDTDEPSTAVDESKEHRAPELKFAGGLSAIDSDMQLFTGERPRFSPDGRRAAFHYRLGDTLQIFVADFERGGIYQITDLPGNARDPVWMSDSDHLIFASDHGDESYDLYRVDHDGIGLTRVTELQGDTLEPTVSPSNYELVALVNDKCSQVGRYRRFEVYQKVAFAYRPPEGGEEIWFSSMKPAPFEPFWFDERTVQGVDGARTGRISPEGESCRSPAYSGDGLHLTFACGEDPSVIYDAPTRLDDTYRHSNRPRSHFFADHICPKMPGRIEPTRECIAEFTPSFARHQGIPRPAPEGSLYRPTFSTNNVHLLADDGESLFILDRFEEEPRWRPLAAKGGTAKRNPQWLPTGQGVAFDDGESTFVTLTDFYLQDVVNLHYFPELLEEPSEQLAEDGLVLRSTPGTEFFQQYIWLASQERPQLVTADAMIYGLLFELLRRKGFSQPSEGVDQDLLRILLNGEGEWGEEATELDEFHREISLLLRTLVEESEFATTDSWRARLRSSALGGYVHFLAPLKPYNFNDLQKNCQAQGKVFSVTELPVGRPRSVVDPVPEFFEELARIAEAIEVSSGSGSLQVAAVARELAEISRAQMDQQPLTAEQNKLLERINIILQQLALGSAENSTINRHFRDGVVGPGEALDVRLPAASGGDDEEALHIGTAHTGRLYLIVPDDRTVARRLTEGPVFSAYDELREGAEEGVVD